MMDDFEKRVLRLRKTSFAQNVKIDMDFLSSMRRSNLITEDMLQVIKSEKNEEHRAFHFLDHVMSSQVANAFDVFTNVLMTDYAWLAKELQADLKAERGNLQIDDDVMKEAGMLVHRKFGTSKRISEMDKKDMQELIAVKIQISKEEWKEEIGALQQQIHSLEAGIGKEEKKARDIDAFLQKFIKDNESKLMSLAHGMQTCGDVLRNSDDDADALAILRTRAMTIITRTKVVMEERDLLFDDREKCFGLLGVSSSGNANGSASMHSLYDALKSRSKSGNSAAGDAAVQLRAQLEEKEKVIQRLRKLSGEFEAEIDGNESKVKGIKDDLAARTSENLELKSRMQLMEREMEEMRAAAAAAAAASKKGRRPSKT